jgi:predicted ribosomally synthesized peptide with nif11-like leader
MKTVEEFIQRLKDDPDFELQAQAYENSEEFINFVKSAGYDFTLDQLLDRFKHEEKAAHQPAEPPPVTAKTLEAFVQRLKDDPDFEHKAQTFENDDAFMEFVKREGYNFTLDQLTDWFNQVAALAQPQTEGPPIARKVAATPIPPLPDGSEMTQQADPSPPGAEAQKRSGALSPKFEGLAGGRRRGMKWQNGDS